MVSHDVESEVCLVLQAAFTPADPKSAKKYSQAVSLFALLGSMLLKAACKMLMKLTPRLNFINVLRTAFELIDPKGIKRH